MPTGIVYKLTSTHSTQLYVGSTQNPEQRRDKHKYNTDHPSSDKYEMQLYVHIREHGGWDNWNFVELEIVQFDKRHDLKVRERHWIEHLGASLNKNIPTRTDKEYQDATREHHREMGRAHYHKNAERFKQYRIDNSETIKVRNAAYYNKNRERVAERGKQYRESHAEEISARRCQKCKCECGIEYTPGHAHRHRLTARHSALLAAKIIPPTDIVPTDPDATHNSPPPVQLVQI